MRTCAEWEKYEKRDSRAFCGRREMDAENLKKTSAVRREDRDPERGTELSASVLDLEKRMQTLEERIAFFEHGSDALNRAEFEMEKRLFRLEQENRRLLEEVRRLREILRDPFNPQLEKPPHY